MGGQVISSQRVWEFEGDGIWMESETDPGIFGATECVREVVRYPNGEIKTFVTPVGAPVQEDFLIYVCPTHGEYRVPTICEPTGPWAGQWVVADGSLERCPACGEFGRDLTEEDPDVYWQADARAEEE